MTFADSHTHLYFDDYKDDIDAVAQRCLDNNVKYCVIAGVSSETVQPILDLCAKFPELCYPSVGLHPTDVKENYLEELQIVENELSSRKYFAVGETGLDYYWDKTFEKEQKYAFEKQIFLAKQFNLPLIIHSRDAFDDTVKVLEEQNGNFGVFHCFSGDVKQAKKVIEMGFYLGIGGVLTFKKNKLIDVVKEIDLQHILLETDAPFLAPTPYRGKRNESSYIPIIAQTIAEIKNISIEEVAENTTQNTLKLFSLLTS